MPDDTILKSTNSICPTCREQVPANVVKRHSNEKEQIYLIKQCAQHGTVESLISSDARFYYLSKGSGETDCGTGCGCAQPALGDRIGFLGRNATLEIPKNDPSPFHKLSTCLALIEIVDSCNLACPTCFADSPMGTDEAITAYSFEDITRRIQDVLDRKGKIEILQLSGGEPTLHPRFFDILDWCHKNPDIDYVLVNSNGVRLARDEEFAQQLKQQIDYGHFQFYLQYDGPEKAGEKELRGGDLRSLKKRAIEKAGELNIPLTLAMTVIPENLAQLWSTVAFGIQYPHIRGVSFQPMFGSGRTVSKQQSHLNTADIILGLVEQSDDKLSFDDFTPLPCGDPNCATIGYLLKVNDEIRSISEFVDFQTLQGFISDRIRYNLDDLEQCGCESEPLGELLHKLELDERSTFRLFIKPFMDMDSWDQDRIDRCCTHVIRPDGVLDSFCRYYLNGGATAYQKAPQTAAR